jgi:hypothetical protein
MWWTGIDAAKAAGFTGFKPIRELLAGDLREIPQSPGVYLILAAPCTAPTFLVESLGGHFKGKNPTVKSTILSAKWVSNVHVVYVGKAGGDNSSNLRSRLKAYLQFGSGKPVGHWGGRYIWQVEGHRDLLVAWRTLDRDVPVDVEQKMLDEFTAAHGKLPFANCRR